MFGKLKFFFIFKMLGRHYLRRFFLVQELVGHEMMEIVKNLVLNGARTIVDHNEFKKKKKKKKIYCLFETENIITAKVG